MGLFFSFQLQSLVTKNNTMSMYIRHGLLTPCKEWQIVLTYYVLC